MADDYNKVGNKLPAPAAASSLPVSKDKEEVSPPLPATHDFVKQTKTKPPRPLLPAAVLVDVTPPASPVAVLPADDDNEDDDDDGDEAPPLPVADRVLLTVCMWAFVHALAFAVALIIAGARHPLQQGKFIMHKSLTWLLPPCVALTDAAAAELIAVLYGELGCIIAAGALAVPLFKLLTAKSCIIRGRWAAAAVDAMAWGTLAATAGMHCMHVASDRIYLAADPGEKYFFVDVVLVSGFLTVDVVFAGFLLCCRRGLGEHQGDDDTERSSSL